MRSVYIVPTRGRPANAYRLASRWLETTGDTTRVFFVVDNDDPELQNYHDALAPLVGDMRVSYVVGERRRVGPTLNYWAPKLTGEYDAIGFMGDDHLPRDKNWDAFVLRVRGTRNFIAYGDDLIQRANLPTAVVMDSRLIKTLGYMVPPGLTHLYLDNFWRDLGEQLGTLSYHPDIVIEHLHPIAHKAEWDDGYREVNDGTMYADDAAAYAEYQSSGDFNTDLLRLRESVDA